MRTQDLTEIARQMIRMHGLRAQAVATMRAAEMQARGEAAEHDRWEAIQSVISELKQRRARKERSAWAAEDARS